MTANVSIVALRTRVTELASLVGPPRTAAPTDEALTAEFAAALSRALDAGGSDTVGDDGRIAPSRTRFGVGAASTATSPVAAGTGVSAPTGVIGQDLVDAARAYLGVPYVWGGESLAEGGLDCSGLVQRSLADLEIAGVPRVARDQATLGASVASLAEALPGDLLVFDGGSHIGIYVGDGQMIDAPRPGKAVQQRAVYETPTTIRRVLPSSAAPPSSEAGATVAGADAGPSTGLPDTAAVDVVVQRQLVAALLSE